MKDHLLPCAAAVLVPLRFDEQQSMSSDSLAWLVIRSSRHPQLYQWAGEIKRVVGQVSKLSLGLRRVERLVAWLATSAVPRCGSESLR